MRAVLVHNPKAGAGKPSAKKLMSLLRDAGLSPVYCNVKDEEMADSLEREADIIVAAGGDGTVTRVISALSNREKPIAILPLGTANNVARSLGIFGTVEEIIEGWGRLKEQRLDVCLATGPWGERRFIEAVGVGALADAARRKVREEKSLAKRIEKGRDAFRKAVAKATPVLVDITVGDKRIEGDMLLVEIMNIGVVGPRLRLAPTAEPADGQFDVVCVTEDEREAFLSWLENPEVEDAPVTVETGSRATIGENSAPLRIGDKLSEKSKGKVSVEIEDTKQTILVPSKEDDDATRNGSRGDG